jgi:ABC-type phosphate/phosphonate transport system permease subunit
MTMPQGEIGRDSSPGRRSWRWAIVGAVLVAIVVVVVLLVVYSGGGGGSGGGGY